jgi:preprotein translocase subunit SecG
MTIVFWLLLVIFLLVAASLIYFVLLQEPKQGGGLQAMGSGGASDFMSGRGMSGGLVMLTVYGGAAFMLLAVALNLIRL